MRGTSPLSLSLSRKLSLITSNYKKASFDHRLARNLPPLPFPSRSFVPRASPPAGPARIQHERRVVVNDHVKYLAGWRNNFTTRETPGWHINLWLLRDGRSNFQDRWTLAHQTAQSLGREHRTCEYFIISPVVQARRVQFRVSMRDHRAPRTSLSRTNSFFRPHGQPRNCPLTAP